MYKLPETPDDFNSKYHRSVGFLIFKNKELPNPVSTPAYIERVERIDDNSLVLRYHGIQGTKDNKAWVNSSVRLSNIVSLEFPMPDTGYYCINNCFPCYVDRRAVRQVHRGWSDYSLSLETPEIFRRLEKYDYSKGLKLLRGVTSCEFVDAYFNKPKQKEDNFKILSKDFLAIKASKNHALFYQNFLIGTCNPAENDYGLVIDSSVKGLEDVFYYQVVNNR